MLFDRFEPEWELALEADTEEAPGAAQSYVKIFVNEVLVDVGHAIQPNIENCLTLEPLNVFDREDADAS